MEKGVGRNRGRYRKIEGQRDRERQREGGEEKVSEREKPLYLVLIIYYTTYYYAHEFVVPVQR